MDSIWLTRMDSGHALHLLHLGALILVVIGLLQAAVIDLLDVALLLLHVVDMKIIHLARTIGVIETMSDVIATVHGVQRTEIVR